MDAFNAPREPTAAAATPPVVASAAAAASGAPASPSRRHLNALLNTIFDGGASTPTPPHISSRSSSGLLVEADGDWMGLTETLAQP